MGVGGPRRRLECVGEEQRWKLDFANGQKRLGRKLRRPVGSRGSPLWRGHGNRQCSAVDDRANLWEQRLGMLGVGRPAAFRLTKGGEVGGESHETSGSRVTRAELDHVTGAARLGRYRGGRLAVVRGFTASSQPRSGMRGGWHLTQNRPLGDGKPPALHACCPLPIEERHM